MRDMVNILKRKNNLIFNDMEEKVNETQAFKSLMEKLERIQKENEWLQTQLRKAVTFESVKRMEFHFLVIQNKDSFSKKFVEFAVKEVESALTPVPQEVNESKKEE